MGCVDNGFERPSRCNHPAARVPGTPLAHRESANVERRVGTQTDDPLRFTNAARTNTARTRVPRPRACIGRLSECIRRLHALTCSCTRAQAMLWCRAYANAY